MTLTHKCCACSEKRFNCFTSFGSTDWKKTFSFQSFGGTEVMNCFEHFNFRLIFTFCCWAFVFGQTPNPLPPASTPQNNEWVQKFLNDLENDVYSAEHRKTLFKRWIDNGELVLECSAKWKAGDKEETWKEVKSDDPAWDGEYCPQRLKCQLMFPSGSVRTTSEIFELLWGISNTNFFRVETGSSRQHLVCLEITDNACSGTTASIMDKDRVAFEVQHNDIGNQIIMYFANKMLPYKGSIQKIDKWACNISPVSQFKFGQFETIECYPFLPMTNCHVFIVFMFQFCPNSARVQNRIFSRFSCKKVQSISAMTGSVCFRRILHRHGETSSRSGQIFLPARRHKFANTGLVIFHWAHPTRNTWRYLTKEWNFLH